MNLEKFGNAAGRLSRNPLGIIALFIVLVYGIAALVLGTSLNNLEPGERTPLIWFLVLFPILVLFAFLWLVTKFPRSIYSPDYFETDEGFLKWVQGSASEIAIEIEALRGELSELQEKSQYSNSNNLAQTTTLPRIADIEKTINDRKKYIHFLYDYAQQRVLSDPTLILRAAQKSMEREPKSVPTIVLLDVANFTKYVEEKGPIEAGSILVTYQTIVSKATRIHGGSEISRIGDGHILLFSGPLAAIRTTLELLENITNHPDMKSLSEILKIRAAIGLHTDVLSPNKESEVEKVLKFLHPDEIGVTESAAQNILPETFEEGTLTKISRNGVTFFQVIELTKV